MSFFYSSFYLSGKWNEGTFREASRLLDHTWRGCEMSLCVGYFPPPKTDEANEGMWWNICGRQKTIQPPPPIYFVGIGRLAGSNGFSFSDNYRNLGSYTPVWEIECRPNRLFENSRMSGVHILHSSQSGVSFNKKCPVNELDRSHADRTDSVLD